MDGFWAIHVNHKTTCNKRSLIERICIGAYSYISTTVPDGYRCNI